MPRAIKEEHHVSIVQGGGAYDVVEVTCTKDAEQIIAVLRDWIDGDDEDEREDEPDRQCFYCGEESCDCDML